jgi:hypothetical protein
LHLCRVLLLFGSNAISSRVHELCCRHCSITVQPKRARRRARAAALACLSKILTFRPTRRSVEAVARCADSRISCRRLRTTLLIRLLVRHFMQLQTDFSSTPPRGRCRQYSLCFWSGLSLNSIYGTQVRQGVFDFSRSLFGVPFVIGTILLGIQAVLSVCGHIRISRRADRGTVFQGVGRVGWARSFRWSDLNYVREERVASGRSSYQAIVLRFKPGARGKLRFGRLLSDERREFLISMLRSQIANSEP